MQAVEYFPFNPRGPRLGFLAGAVVCGGLTVAAVLAARGGDRLFAEARAGISFGLMLAFLYVFRRLRPRPQWGVQVTALGVSLSRPFSDEALEVAWSAVEKVFRQGPRRDTVVLSGRRGQVSIARHLFPSAAAFEAMAKAIEARAPQPRFDA